MAIKVTLHGDHHALMHMATHAGFAAAVHAAGPNAYVMADQDIKAGQKFKISAPVSTKGPDGEDVTEIELT